MRNVREFAPEIARESHAGPPRTGAAACDPTAGRVFLTTVECLASSEGAPVTADRILSISCACVLLARLASAAPLPVVFQIDDPEDNTYKEAGTVRLHDLHVEEQVPVVLAVIPCGEPTKLDSPTCQNGTFHLRYRDW